MATTSRSSLKCTGCDDFSLVEGYRPKNFGLLLLVWEPHRVEQTGTVKGNVTVLRSGSGDLASHFEALVGQTIDAARLINRLEEATGGRRMNTLHTNSVIVVGGMSPRSAG